MITYKHMEGLTREAEHICILDSLNDLVQDHLE
jgi:hypothetical protein